MERNIAVRIIVGVLAAAASVATAEDFAVVALPDTQFYSQTYPTTFDSQVQWCVDNRAAWNIATVTHLGDIVNEAATLYQWDNAKHSLTIADIADLPYGLCVGNHDIRYPGEYYDPNATNYLSKFHPSFYQGRPWYGGASPSGLSNYQVVTAGGRQWLFLHLLVETPAAELAWAQNVLNANRDKPTMVSTHRYLYDWRVLGAGRYGAFQYTFEPLYRHDGIMAEDFFYGFVATNRQIYMVMCGHCDGEYRQTSQNNFGLPVHEIMVDYQDSWPNGGDGWMRLMRYRPDADQIEVYTYSPTLNAWRTNSESQFLLNVDFDAYATGRPALLFQDGINGYAATQDTWVNEDAPGSSYGNDDIFVVDDDTTNGWWGHDYQGQGLLRYDNMFRGPVYEGEQAPTQVPLGATIHTATLTLKLADDTDICNPKFYVYRMLRGWDEGATWNSLSGGIVPGQDCEANWIAYFQGDNNPNWDYYRYVNVLPALTAWSGGATNYGLAILPERVSGCDDGIDVWASEVSGVVEDFNGDLVDAVSIRPSLLVEFSYTQINVPPTVTAPLAASTIATYEGDDVEFTMSAQDPNPLDPLTFRVNGEDWGYATGSGQMRRWETMPDEGTYDFVGEVQDDEATVPGGAVSVVVVNVAPTITWLTPDLWLPIDRLFEFRAEARDPGLLDELTYEWDLDGDGEYDDHVGPVGVWSFATVGAHVIGVSVNDGDGGYAFGSFTVRIVSHGDCDGDGDVDLADLAVGFQPCFGQSPLPPECAISDVDGDGDVDMDDFVLWSQLLSGPAE